ncbi:MULTISPECIES: phosphatidylinositol mannoside acyltransferase [unclassified Actinomyces]|uniref:phosphatidylinositol mannoside acyltransferase n=1 Tax=unclassified Actinomyces TaxID=2609248 RepID=UPI002017D2C1|nr:MULTISPECIES: phosphatidylinositol mannoside acyltransferase [unclassified Actinomyces]MCL3778355.1 phosphatidylinositol mannoside acyltransferase [Actinomyces sp. AC-20-1]MCL3790198.1 phosphatidylinositol mannoside acyltransferase [Actinomyces sp. 187325]MCL3792491.1 phosphatidylinositol mannoside acyltransferase [Actinomyces sp. 186855]MCL3794327.1 phosphatidylinositol mannoside acyltransferase [Actinomyces sp. 217892]
MSPAVEDLYRLAWRHAHRLPPRLGYALCHLGADAAWLLHSLQGRRTGAGQLQRNLARLLPDATAAGLRRATRQGMRSYMRYFYEAFALPGTSPDQRLARVRPDIDPRAHEDLAAGSIVVALPHMGNWDLVGAWASSQLAQVLTVAEHLEPDDLFQQFVAFREDLGMRVIGQRRGERVFDSLLAAAQEGHHVIALLADRDLSSAGVQAELGGHAMRAAAGPAALAVRLDLPLYYGTISYERLTGRRRRAAGGPWGVVLRLRKVEEPEPDVGATARRRVKAWTRAWVSALAPDLAAHATDWHMLQPVFDADLDPERLARAHARENDQSPHDAATAGEEPS